MPELETKSQTELTQLWRAYKQTPTSAVREHLILIYAPLVKKVVGRMGLRPDGPIEWEDLLNYGVLGLIDAVERYEPNRGIAFQTFASARIRGAVLDALRQIDPLGRLARRRVRAAKEAIQCLAVELGRTPADHEVADAIGLTEEQYRQVLQDASFVILSLDQPIHEGDDSQPLFLADVLEDSNAEKTIEKVEEAELRERLTESIRALPRREQILLSLYYFEGLTMREVADVMGISQTRVCQLHARTILNLKAMLMPVSSAEKKEADAERCELEPTSEPEAQTASAPKTAVSGKRRSHQRARRLWKELFQSELEQDILG